MHRLHPDRSAVTPGATGDRTGEIGAATTLTIVALTPIVLGLALAGFQASLWSDTSTRARVIAYGAAVEMARSSVDPAITRAITLESLARQPGLSDVELDIDIDANNVAVAVSARLPGLIRGVSTHRRIEIVLPLEGWRE